MRLWVIARTQNSDFRSYTVYYEYRIDGVWWWWYPQRLYRDPCILKYVTYIFNQVMTKSHYPRRLNLSTLMKRLDIMNPKTFVRLVYYQCFRKPLNRLWETKLLSMLTLVNFLTVINPVSVLVTARQRH